MTPEEARAIAAELPEGGLRRAVLASADRIERGDTSPVVLPWSATMCEVCDGAGTLPVGASWPPDRPCMPATFGRLVCWYCKGSGWYEAAT